MKKYLGFIRWKFVIPVAIVCAALVLFFVLFFDPLLAKGIEIVGSKVNGAKVDVSGLKTKFKDGRISIARIQVTNKDNDMKNLVDFGPVAFEIDIPDMFTKRFVIPEASLDGLKFNTDRKTSGKIRKAKKEDDKDADGKPGVATRLYEKYKDRFKVNFDGIKDQAKQKIEFNPKDLAINKQADALKQKADTAPNDWKKTIDQKDFDGRLKKVEAEIKEIQSTPTSGADSIPKVAESLKKLKQVKDEIGQIKTDFETTRSSFTGELNGLKSGISGLQDAKKKDMAGILSRFNLDFADPHHLVEGLVGPILVGRIQTTLKYVDIARKYMPSKKDDTPPPHPRARGMDIHFPTPAAPPRFWLKHAKLAGVFQSISADGVLSNLSTDQPRTGQPFKASLKGDQAGRLFTADILFDHVTEEKKDSLSLEGKNLALKDFATSGFVGQSLKEGVGNAALSVNLIGDNGIAGKIKMDLSGLKFDQSTLMSALGAKENPGSDQGEALKTTFVKGLISSVEKMPVVSIGGDISGTISDPNLSISSNLEGVFSNVIKQTIGNAVKEQQQQLEAKLNAVVDQRKAELDQKVAGLENQLNQQLGNIGQRIDDELKKATGINLGGGGGSPIPGVKIPSLNKLFKH